MTIARLEYVHQLTRVGHYGNKTAIRIIDNNGERAVRECLEHIFENIEAETDEDVILESFLVCKYSLHGFLKFSSDLLTAIFYPKKGIQIRSYKLRQNSFFTNSHENPDPLVVKEIKQPIYLARRIARDEIPLPKGGSLSNRINGAVLFFKSPFEFPDTYPQFSEYMEYLELQQEED